MRKTTAVVLFVCVALLPSVFAQQERLGLRPAAPSPIPLWPVNGDLSNLPPDQYVFLNPQTNEWVVSYPQDLKNPQTSRRVTLRFDSRAQVDPVLLTHVSRQPDGSYSYSYTLGNSRTARTPINKWSLLVPAPDEKFEARHATWTASRQAKSEARDLLAAMSRLTVVEWSGSDAVGPGGASGAFTIRSGYSPGFTTASFSGLVKSEYTDQIASTLPKEVAAQVARVLQPASDSQVRMVLAPRFPAGAHQIVVVDNFHFSISALAQLGKLDANSPFVKDAQAALRDFLSSGGAAPLSVDRLGFLAKAGPGLESEIAAALKLSLSQ